MRNQAQFEKELSSLINRYSMENGSNTPDYILARYLVKCLENYNDAVCTRNCWYGTDQTVFSAFGDQQVQPR